MGRRAPAQPYADHLWLRRYARSQRLRREHACEQAPDPSYVSVAGRRDAWCYGAPGIGRALMLAGEALNDRGLIETGRGALGALGQRDANTWDTEGPGLCHGSAGVLVAAVRSACPAVAQQAAIHTRTFRGRSPYGFTVDDQGNAIEPGFLTGATGTALALAQYSGLLAADTLTPWDALLLLA